MNAGNIILVKPTGDFIMVSKGAIRDNSVDPFSLGIYVKILAFGETDWQLNIKGLASYLNLTEEKIRRAFRVLEAAGYLRRQRVRDEANRFVGWNYEIGCVPFPTFGDSRPSENPDVGENRPSGNRVVNNNTSTGYKDLKQKEDTTNNYTYRDARFVPPSVEDVRAYCEERRNGISAQQFVDYYTANGWMVGKSKMKDWRAAVRNWETRRRDNPAPQAPRPAERRYLSPEERTLRALAQLQARDGQLNTFAPDEQ